MNIQLTTEQQGFELRRPTYMWDFLSRKSCSATWSAAGWILECGAMDIGESADTGDQ